MPSLFNNKVKTRRPKEMPPNFTPEKNQGTPISQGTGPVVNKSGMGQTIIGPSQGKGFGPGQGPSFGPGSGQNMAGKIRPCRGRFTYLWLRNRSEFWFFIERVTPQYIYGWRFQRGRWEDGRIALNRIERFFCFRREQ